MYKYGDYKTAIPFEQDYEDIVFDSNIIWTKYEQDIMQLVKNIAFQKNYDKDELLQLAYLFFRELCEKYDPYYQDHFYPFNYYLFSNLKQKLLANVQVKYKNDKRMQTTDDDKLKRYSQQETLDNDLTLDLNEFLQQLPTEYQKVFKLLLEGHTQSFIGDELNVSQARINKMIKNIKGSLIMSKTTNLDNPILKAAKNINYIIPDNYKPKKMQDFKLNTYTGRTMSSHAKQKMSDSTKQYWLNKKLHEPLND